MTLTTTPRMMVWVFLFVALHTHAQEITTMPAQPHIHKTEFQKRETTNVARVCTHKQPVKAVESKDAVDPKSRTDLSQRPTNVTAYTQSIHNVIVKWETGSFYSFRMGTTPGAQDIRWGQLLNADAKNTGGHSYEELRVEALNNFNGPTTFNIGDTFYITMDYGLGTEWTSPALSFQWEDLGDNANDVTINIETNYGVGGVGPFSAAQATKMQEFYTLVNPIIKDIYGPPSRNHDVFVVNDGFAVGVNTYYNGPNQISTSYVLNSDGDLDQPRLMIHELLHAYRDNVTLSSDNEWHYETTLSGFEEGFAEGVALVVMDRFIELYPNFFNGDEFKIHWGHSRGMPFDWDYDFQNHEQLTTTDFFSSDIGTGAHWERYGTAAAAMYKLYLEDPDIFKKFNAEYYSRLNADHSLIPSRALIVDIFNTIITEVERTPTEDWINDQRIFDCTVVPGKKVHMLTFHGGGYWAYLSHDNRVQVIETQNLPDANEWGWDVYDNNGNATERWYHQLNNLNGTLQINDYDNSLYRQVSIRNNKRSLSQGSPEDLGPYQGPNEMYYNGIFTGNDGANDCTQPGCGKRPEFIEGHNFYSTSSDPNISGGVINNSDWFFNLGLPDEATQLVFNMNKTGLFSYNISFTDPAGGTIDGTYFRLHGDGFIDQKGMYAGIRSTTGTPVEGKVYVEHENHGEEAEVVINNGALVADRQWASILETDPSRQGGRTDRRYSDPGKIHAIFVSDDCSEQKIDFRNITYGDGLNGIQMLLFTVEDFEDIIFTESADLSLCPGDAASFSVSNNFPDILDTDSRITYTWYDPNGNVVSNSADYDIATVDATDAGDYVLEINAYGCTLQRTVRLTLCTANLDFDGVDDYASTSAFLGGYTGATMMSWIKTDELRNADILGQRNFRVSMNAAGFLSAFIQTNAGGFSITDSSQALVANVWHHVAATFDVSSNTLRLYLNGEMLQEVTTTGTEISDTAIWNDDHDFEIGRNTENDNNYFKGDINEVRVYDIGLTTTQLQEQVYQQIEADGVNIRGAVLGNTVASIAWDDLKMYLKMEQTIAGETPDASSSGVNMSLHNMSTNQALSAPMPYVANASGAWTATSTWANGTEWDITDVASNKPWTIVQLSNNAQVTTINSHEHLGLVIDSGASLEVNNDVAITNTKLLVLNGVLDLQDESQLIQTADSDLQVSSAGTIERDQQATANSFAYNYWGSPVGAVSTTTNNTAYNLRAALMDGTDKNNPIAVNFDPSPFAADNGATSPITISSYWIYTFVNAEKDNYDLWQQIGSQGNLEVGQGFTMKGAGTGGVSDEQNLVFTGKPNNGLIQLPLGNSNEYLVGNPYPSAIDANEFIMDNPTTDGTIRLWDSFEGTSHNTAEYQGGYALYNLSGGSPAMSHPDVDQGGTGSKIPTRYIPVAQGFFIGDDDTNTTAGNIVFENDQRVFMTESSGNSVFIRNGTDNRSAPDERTKIRLGFDSSEGFHRQLLLTIDTNATEGLDRGYDAVKNEVQEDDMYWKIDDSDCIIQGIPEILETTELPLFVTIDNAGTVDFMIDALENLDREMSIFLEDNQENIMHDLQQSNYSVSLERGAYKNRFQLVFVEKALSLDTSETGGLSIVRIKNTNLLKVLNREQLVLQEVTMYNMLGQLVKKWTLQTTGDVDLELPTYSTGSYIIKVASEQEVFSKQIVLK